MDKRTDLNIQFAGNGIIVTRMHPDYSRNACVDKDETLVFNNLIDFERWFERHSGMADDDYNPTALPKTNAEYVQMLRDMRGQPRKKIQKIMLNTARQAGKSIFADMMKGAHDDWKDAMIYGIQGMKVIENPALKNDEVLIIDESAAIEPVALQKLEPFEMRPVDEEQVDALREAEALIKRFCGAKV